MLRFTRLEAESKPRPLSGQRKACMLFTSSAENLLLIFSYHSLLCKVPTTGLGAGQWKTESNAMKWKGTNSHSCWEPTMMQTRWNWSLAQYGAVSQAVTRWSSPFRLGKHADLRRFSSDRHIQRFSDPLILREVVSRTPSGNRDTASFFRRQAVDKVPSTSSRAVWQAQTRCL